MPKRKKKALKENVEKIIEEAGKKVENPKVCPDCGSKDINHDKEEFYCKKCGYVLENI